MEVVGPCQQGLGAGSGSQLGELEVSQLVLVGLAMDQPLKANFFPGILEGLAGRLGLMPPGVTDPPTLSRADVS